MASPRKKYRPKPICNPLNMRDPWAIEGEAHAALLAMESGDVEESHLAMLAAHADMVRRLYGPDTPERRQADTIIRVIYEIKQRGGLRILHGEDLAIRAAVKVTLPAIRSASNMDIYRVAVASIQDMDRNGGAVRISL